MVAVAEEVEDMAAEEAVKEVKEVEEEEAVLKVVVDLEALYLLEAEAGQRAALPTPDLPIPLP